LPVAGSTVVPTGTGEPAAVLVVGEGTVLLRHLGGELQQEPLVALAPDPLDPANTTSGTPPRTHSDLAGSEVEPPRP